MVVAPGGRHRRRAVLCIWAFPLLRTERGVPMDAKLTTPTCGHAAFLEEEPLMTALPVDAEHDADHEEARDPSTLGLVELLLKNPTRLDATMNRDERRPVLLIPRFLAIALASYLLFSIAMIVILNTAP